jgi:hypothetical protein
MPQAQKMGDKQEESTLEVLQFHPSIMNTEHDLAKLHYQAISPNKCVIKDGTPVNKDEEEKLNTFTDKRVFI